MNEIQGTFTLNVNNPSNGTGFADTINAGQIQINQTNVGEAAGTATATTTAANMNFADLSSSIYGILWMRNLDSVNSVTFGVNVSGSMQAIGQMLAGEMAFFRVLPSIAGIMLQSSASTVEVQYKLFAL